MATIAFLGIGLMGSQMAKRLREAGHAVRVWNRSREKAVAWAKDGGTVCETPEQAATGALEVHLMLADDKAVETALFGEHGALRTLAHDSLVVDHSTVSVNGTKERAARLATGGWRFLQAPCLASPTAVSQGQGLMLVGGPQEVYRSDEATLRQIIERLWWVGEKTEDAAAFKLMANAMLVCIVEALAEYFAIGQANGITGERAMQLFEHFDPGSTIKLRGPRMAKGDYTPAFTLGMAQKDVRLMLEAAGDAATVPALKAIYDKLARAVDRGHRELDLAGLAADIIPPAKTT